QVRYCEKEGRVVYEPVKLQQEYSSFDFLSPWEGGVNNQLPPEMPLSLKVASAIAGKEGV
ncbi:MAG: hypothetical protein NWR39_00740, partial [Pseudomonadota bacterium]|nr:hypothetical protein [Pseudomonadota bacterium]